MKRYTYILLGILILLASASCKQEDSHSEITKIALRDIGNRLLLSNQDSTSLILPVIEVNSRTYELSFQKELGFKPDSLVTFVRNSLDKANLPEHYRVEVIQCKDKEVAYSYVMKNEEEKSIIPCAGRALPRNCYTIQIRFDEDKGQSSIIYLWFLVPLVLIVGFVYKQKTKRAKPPIDALFYKIGNYKFDKDQSKLLYVEKEIGLSKKECELLEILCDNLNDVVKRDELSKRVWEDHGVFVGRSLDTYISKLRKKLKEDASIKITNVHGVGYKLEVQKK